MRIGVLATEMQRSPTGVGRYLRGLLGHVGDERPDWKWVLYFQDEPFEDPLFDHACFEPVFCGLPDVHPVLFEQFRLPRSLRDLDVFFSPAYSLPRGLECPSLVAIHDLSFEVLPEEFGFKERWRRRWLARRAVRSARRVLTISPLVTRQLQEMYAVDAGKISELPLAVDEDLTKAVGRPPEEEIGGPFALFAGSILARRRLDVVLESFGVLMSERPELKLVLAGANRLRNSGQLGRWIESFGVTERVVELGWVKDSALIWLLRNAELSFYLSTYEGYGLPPMESLAVGTPVVVSPGLALDHLWPDYPYRCRSIAVDEVVRVSRRILTDSEERERVIGKGRALIASLSWKRSAELFVKEIEKAAAS
jgi:glycosyltransferase involved in cell wall biosynthesis